MSLCFSYSISSSFTSTKGCLLFSTASNCTLPSPRSSLSSSSVSQLVSSSTSFVLSFSSSFGHGNISVEICHQFLTTFSTLLLKFFRYLALPIRRSIFLTLDTLKNFQSSNPISVTFATLRFDFSVDFSLVCHTYTCLWFFSFLYHFIAFRKFKFRNFWLSFRRDLWKSRRWLRMIDRSRRLSRSLLPSRFMN